MSFTAELEDEWIIRRHLDHLRPRTAPLVENTQSYPGNLSSDLVRDDAMPVIDPEMQQPTTEESQLHATPEVGQPSQGATPPPRRSTRIRRPPERHGD